MATDVLGLREAVRAETRASIIAQLRHMAQGPGKEDIKDWLAQGYTRQDITLMCETLNRAATYLEQHPEEDAEYRGPEDLT